MQKFNSMSELIAFMAHRKAPNQLQDSAKDRMKEIEECNVGGSSAFKAIYIKMTKRDTSGSERKVQNKRPPQRESCWGGLFCCI